MGRACRGKATIRRGWPRSRNAFAVKRKPKAIGRKRSSASWNGCACLRMAVRPKAKRASASIWIFLAQDPVKRMAELEIYIPPGPRLGDLVIEAQGVAKAYGDNLLYENLTFKVPPAAIIGIIGPNGAGKTTLFRMITGQEKPDKGNASGRRYGQARLCGSIARLFGRRENRLAGALRRAG